MIIRELGAHGHRQGGTWEREAFRHPREQTGWTGEGRGGCSNRKPELGTGPPGGLRKAGFEDGGSAQTWSPGSLHRFLPGILEASLFGFWEDLWPRVSVFSPEGRLGPALWPPHRTLLGKAYRPRPRLELGRFKEAGSLFSLQSGS